MDGLPRAARARRGWRRGWLRRVVTPLAMLFGAAAVVIVGPLAGPVGANVATERIEVPARAVDGVATAARLLAGTTYELRASGMYEGPNGLRADVECSSTSLGVWSRDRSSGPSLDLLVDGRDVAWEALGFAAFGCASNHEFRVTVTPSTTGPLQLRIDGGAEQGSFLGAVVVEITGPAFAPADTAADEPEPAPAEPGTQPAEPAPAEGAPAAAPSSPQETTGPSTPASPQVSPAPAPQPSPAGPGDAPPAPAGPPTGEAALGRPAATRELLALFLGDTAGSDEAASPVRQEIELVADPPEPQEAARNGVLVAGILLLAAAAGVSGVGIPVVRFLNGLGANRRRVAPWRQGHPAGDPAVAPASPLERSYFG